MSGRWGHEGGHGCGEQGTGLASTGWLQGMELWALHPRESCCGPGQGPWKGTGFAPRLLSSAPPSRLWLLVFSPPCSQQSTVRAGTEKETGEQRGLLDLFVEYKAVESSSL